MCDTTILAQKTVKATGHTPVIDAVINPNCTEGGKTEGFHCAVCDFVIKAQTIIPARGHTLVAGEAESPTCTEVGKTAGSFCAVCDVVIETQTFIPAKGHTPVVLPATNPTSDEVGLSAGLYCGVCNEVFEAQTPIPALPANIPVTNIEMPPVLNVYIGQSFNLTPIVLPDNASNVKLEWTSSNKDVATVLNGLLTAKAAGTVTITARASDGSGASASSTVIITQAADKIIITSTVPAALDIGETFQLETTVSPADTTDKTLVWSSSDPKIATVDKDGLITAVSAGQVTLSAASRDGKAVSEPITLNIVKRTYNMTMARWDYSQPLIFNGREQSVVITGLPDGLIPSYTGNMATEVGKYSASVTFTSKLKDYEIPAAFEKLEWEVQRQPVPGDASDNGSVGMEDFASLIDYILNGNENMSMINANTVQSTTSGIDMEDLIWLMHAIVNN